MILEEKKEYILGMLDNKRILRTKELSKELNCTEASIRNIINDLAKKKLLNRVHGGVMKEEQTIIDLPESITRTLNIEKKEYIANIARNFIEDNSTIIFNAGSTNFIIANKLNNIKNLNVITNSIKIANLLSQNTNINVIMLGGVVRAYSYATVNYSEENNVKNFKANKLFLDIAAVSLENGLTEPSIQEARVEKDMIGIADEVIILADSTKFDKVALSIVAPLNVVNKIITDQEIDKQFVEKIKQMNIEIYY